MSDVEDTREELIQKADASLQALINSYETLEALYQRAIATIETVLTTIDTANLPRSLTSMTTSTTSLGPSCAFCGKPLAEHAPGPWISEKGRCISIFPPRPLSS